MPIKTTDQRMKRMYQDEKDFSVMPGVPSWACVASAICIKAFSFLLNRILTRWTSPYTPAGIKEKFRLFVLKTQFTANNPLSADLSVSLLKAEGDSNSSHLRERANILKDITHTKVCLWCWQLLNCRDNNNGTHWACVWENLNIHMMGHNLQIISRLCVCKEIVSSLSFYPLLPS